MKEKLQKKAIGYYFAALAGILAVVSMIRFMMWAPGHSGMDMVIVGVLAAGVICDVILTFRDNDYIIILSTVCYSVAVVKLLTNSVGSFVDAFQGINMFGDASQVNRIISIAAVMGISVLLSVFAGFLKRVRQP